MTDREELIQRIKEMTPDQLLLFTEYMKMLQEAERTGQEVDPERVKAFYTWGAERGNKIPN